MFLPDENAETGVFAKYADLLSPSVRALTVDDDGLLVGISSDPRDDNTIFVPYYRYSTLGSLTDRSIVCHSQLHELHRLGSGVDLMLYEDEAGIVQHVALKFIPLKEPVLKHKAWFELHILKNLPPHPKLITFDRIVLEDVESRLIGFTTKYNPGGTLE